MKCDVIKESLKQLIKEKSYSQISIQDIARKANISRRTFYQYYENKMQVFEEVVGDFIEDSLRPFEKNENNQIFSSKIQHFTHTLIENMDTVESLFNENCPDILGTTIEKILTTQIQKDYKGFLKKNFLILQLKSIMFMLFQ